MYRDDETRRLDAYISDGEVMEARKRKERLSLIKDLIVIIASVSTLAVTIITHL